MKLISSLFISTISLIWVTSPAISQSINSHDLNDLATHKSDDLTGIEPRNSTNWNWAVGGRYAETPEYFPLDSRELRLNLFEAKLDKLNRTYELHDRQLGDTQRPTRRFPVTEF